MRNFKTYNLLIALLLGGILIFPSCDVTDGEFLDRYPSDTPSPDIFFVDESSAAQAVTAAYQPWTQGHSLMYRRDLALLLDAMSDDVHWRQAGSNDITQADWNITPDHGTMYVYWREIYRSINAANWAIKNIPKLLDKGLSQETIDPYIAEARFLRAFGYLFLTNFYGDVPLILSPLSNFEEFEQPRNPSAEVFEQIVTDFTFARENLPEQWPSERTGAATKAAAAAYLAKAELFRENYTAAETAARTAIQIAESTGYELVPDFPGIFEYENEPSPEVIFYMGFKDNDPDQGSNHMVEKLPRDLPAELYHVWGAGGWGYHLPQRDLYDAFEDGDPRRGYTIFAPGDFFGIYSAGEPFTYEHQSYNEDGELITYEVTYTDGDSIEYDMRWSPAGMNVRKGIQHIGHLANVRWSGMDIPLYRMSDLYLVLAEALAEQGKNEALDWVNKVRARPTVDMPPKTLADGNLVDLVRHERRVELAMEGQRLWDLIRWREMKNVFGDGTKVKRHFFSDYLPADQLDTKYNAPQLDNYPGDLVLFPIPQREMDQNSKITEQNPGY